MDNYRPRLAITNGSAMVPVPSVPFPSVRDWAHSAGDVSLAYSGAIATIRRSGQVQPTHQLTLEPSFHMPENVQTMQVAQIAPMVQHYIQHDQMMRDRQMDDAIQTVSSLSPHPAPSSHTFHGREEPSYAPYTNVANVFPDYNPMFESHAPQRQRQFLESIQQKIDADSSDLVLFDTGRHTIRQMLAAKKNKEMVRDAKMEMKEKQLMITKIAEKTSNLTEKIKASLRKELGSEGSSSQLPTDLEEELRISAKQLAEKASLEKATNKEKKFFGKIAGQFRAKRSLDMEVKELSKNFAARLQERCKGGAKTCAAVALTTSATASGIRETSSSSARQPRSTDRRSAAAKGSHAAGDDGSRSNSRERQRKEESGHAVDIVTISDDSGEEMYIQGDHIQLDTEGDLAISRQQAIAESSGAGGLRETSTSSARQPGSTAAGGSHTVGDDGSRSNSTEHQRKGESGHVVETVITISDDSGEEMDIQRDDIQMEMDSTAEPGAGEELRTVAGEESISEGEQRFRDQISLRFQLVSTTNPTDSPDRIATNTQTTADLPTSRDQFALSLAPSKSKMAHKDVIQDKTALTRTPSDVASASREFSAMSVTPSTSTSTNQEIMQGRMESLNLTDAVSSNEGTTPCPAAAEIEGETPEENNTQALIVKTEPADGEPVSPRIILIELPKELHLENRDDDCAVLSSVQVLNSMEHVVHFLVTDPTARNSELGKIFVYAMENPNDFQNVANFRDTLKDTRHGDLTDNELALYQAFGAVLDTLPEPVRKMITHEVSTIAHCPRNENGEYVSDICKKGVHTVDSYFVDVCADKKNNFQHWKTGVMEQRKKAILAGVDPDEVAPYKLDRATRTKVKHVKALSVNDVDHVENYEKCEGCGETYVYTGQVQLSFKKETRYIILYNWEGCVRYLEGIQADGPTTFLGEELKLLSAIRYEPHHFYTYHFNEDGSATIYNDAKITRVNSVDLTAIGNSLRFFIFERKDLSVEKYLKQTKIHQVEPKDILVKREEFDEAIIIREPLVEPEIFDDVAFDEKKEHDRIASRIEDMSDKELRRLRMLQKRLREGPGDVLDELTLDDAPTSAENNQILKVPGNGMTSDQLPSHSAPDHVETLNGLQQVMQSKAAIPQKNHKERRALPAGTISKQLHQGPGHDSPINLQPQISSCQTPITPSQLEGKSTTVSNFERKRSVRLMQKAEPKAANSASTSGKVEEKKQTVEEALISLDPEVVKRTRELLLEMLFKPALEEYDIEGKKMEDVMKDIVATGAGTYTLYSVELHDGYDAKSVKLSKGVSAHLLGPQPKRPPIDPDTRSVPKPSMARRSHKISGRQTPTSQTGKPKSRAEISKSERVTPTSASLISSGNGLASVSAQVPQMATNSNNADTMEVDHPSSSRAQPGAISSAQSSSSCVYNLRNRKSK